MQEQDKKTSCYIIAEMACSHEGQIDLAKHIIDSSAKAGANAIQFQIWKLSDMVVPQHPDYKMMQGVELSYDNWRELASYTRKKYPGLDIIACVYEKLSVDFCEEINVDAYKIHSSDLSNPALIKYIALNKKRIDLSVGASSLDEIQDALSWIRSKGKCPIWLMYGYQNFPTQIDQIHLAYLKTLQNVFQLPVGYQDHTDPEMDASFWLPAFSMGLSIRIIEKHITHDRSAKGVDHEAALNPDEFDRFVDMIRTLESANGIAAPRDFSKEEIKYRIYAKKSIVAAVDLKKGTRLATADITWMRAEKLGLPPANLPKLIGKKLTKSVNKYQLILEDILS